MRMRFSLFNSFLIVALTGVLAAFNLGCNTAYLAQGEKLYTGADVNIVEKETIPDKSELKNQLELLARPEPNGKLLGLFRLKLWLYNIGFFKGTFGEPPVLLQSAAARPDCREDAHTLRKQRVLLAGCSIYGS
jgi:hypothetical protein